VFLLTYRFLLFLETDDIAMPRVSTPLVFPLLFASLGPMWMGGCSDSKAPSAPVAQQSAPEFGSSEPFPAEPPSRAAASPPPEQRAVVVASSSADPTGQSPLIAAAFEEPTVARSEPVVLLPPIPYEEDEPAAESPESAVPLSGPALGGPRLTEELPADDSLVNPFRTAKPKSEGPALIPPESPTHTEDKSASVADDAPAVQVASRDTDAGPRLIPEGAVTESEDILKPVEAREKILSPGEQLPAPRLPGNSNHRALVSQRAKEHIRYGFELADRGAVYSARDEFYRGLKLVAQALDAESLSRKYTSAMTAGLTALEEADDFLGSSSSLLDPQPDLAALCAAHSTPVLKQVDVSGMMPTVAMQHYYAYAQQQLIEAGGNEPAVSMALYGLGRLQPALVHGPQDDASMRGPKAMVLHQAALAVDERNYRAANELGVLFARYGQLEEAENALKHSLAVSPQPETWHNLATIYRRQGRSLEAEQARNEYGLLAGQSALRSPAAAGSPAAGMAASVRWVDPQSFAATSNEGRLAGLSMHGTGERPQPAAAAPVGNPTMPREAEQPNDGGSWFSMFKPHRSSGEPRPAGRGRLAGLNLSGDPLPDAERSPRSPHGLREEPRIRQATSFRGE